VLDAPRLRFSLIWSQREFNDSGYKALATLAEHRLPLTGLAENFSPMLRMAPPPFAREIDGKEGPFCAATSLPPGFSARSLDHLSRSFLAFILSFPVPWWRNYKNHERRAPSVAVPMHATTCTRAIPNRATPIELPRRGREEIGRIMFAAFVR
jgi:hypothetical protein